MKINVNAVKGMNVMGMDQFNSHIKGILRAHSAHAIRLNKRVLTDRYTPVSLVAIPFTGETFLLADETDKSFRRKYVSKRAIARLLTNVGCLNFQVITR